MKNARPNEKIVRRLLVAVAIGLTLIGPALSAANPVEDETSDRVCARVAQLAGVFMAGRQNGMALSKALEIAGDNGLARLLVMEAWAQPRMQVEENQRRSIEEFRDTWHLACLQARN